MSGKAGSKGGPAKIPKKTKWEPDDDDDDLLDDLVVDTETAKQPSYSTLKLGGFVTKAEDRKERLEKRRAKKKDDDKADDVECKGTTYPLVSPCPPAQMQESDRRCQTPASCCWPSS